MASCEKNMKGVKRKNYSVLCFQKDLHFHVISQSSKGNRMKLGLDDKDLQVKSR